jgi:hypothetical protein
MAYVDPSDHVEHYRGVRWRRIYHHVGGHAGAFDVSVEEIVQLAAAGSMVHVRTAGQPDRHSATSKPGSWPIECLRGGRCFNVPLDGRRPSAAVLAEAWELQGSCKLTDLLDKTQGAVHDLSSGWLYHASYNTSGLHLLAIAPGTRFAQWSGPRCSWRFATNESDVPAPVEVFIDEAAPAVPVAEDATACGGGGADDHSDAAASAAVQGAGAAAAVACASAAPPAVPSAGECGGSVGGSGDGNSSSSSSSDDDDD